MQLRLRQERNEPRVGFRAALDRDPGFVRGVANDLAERLRDSHPDDQPFKRKIQDILTEEIQQFAGGDQSELLAVEN